MSRSSLFGRRVHIVGSVNLQLSTASTQAVEDSRAMLKELIPELVRRGANFVIPVDAENLRPADGQPICFDWLVWQAISDNLHLRPANVPNPLAIAVQHHKTEGQIPEPFIPLWDRLRSTDHVQIENASHWNMSSKRMEVASKWGDILIALGGSDGVLYTAELYHDAGKPVIPLPDALCQPDAGARKLFSSGLSSSAAARLFRTTTQPSHAWVNRLNAVRATPKQRTDTLLLLLEALEPPEAFAVRLLDDSHPDFNLVDDFFSGVVKPIIEGELGYVLRVIDGKQAYERSRIDQEIFTKLRRSRLVVSDLTGERPNCFLETGLAIGREIPTIVMCKEGGSTHFDLRTVATHFWRSADSLEEKKRKLREHLAAVRDRPPLAPAEPLIC